jgi:hypothetical protein
MRRDSRERWIGLALCAVLGVAWAAGRTSPDAPAGGPVFAPAWLGLVAAAVGGAGLLPVRGAATRRPQAALRWLGLLLLVWAANGLPFDALTAAGLIGRPTASGELVVATVWWPGLVTRAVALGTAIVVGHIAFARPASPPSHARLAGWALAAFVLAMPYPVLRLHWALGGPIGLVSPGAAGEGFEPLVIAIPWVAAAILSLVLAADRPGPGRGLVVAAGWIAAAVVATIGPAALWSIVRAVADGTATRQDGIEPWVFALFYGSWFLWAVAGGAATRAYQLRTPTRVDERQSASPSQEVEDDAPKNRTMPAVDTRAAATAQSVQSPGAPASGVSSGMLPAQTAIDPQERPITP